MLKIVHEKDYEKVTKEISDCQGRVLQTFVPTIIAIGLIPVADKQKFALVTLVCAFSILFGSSLYVASLSYKIFRNAAFIQVLTELSEYRGMLSWERVLLNFNQKRPAPGVLGTETRTVAAIYATFSATYILMFYEINQVLVVFFGIILMIIAVKIWFIPKQFVGYLNTWKTVLDENINSNSVQSRHMPKKMKSCPVIVSSMVYTPPPRKRSRSISSRISR